MRPYLKARMTDKPESHEAVEIIQGWKQTRSMATNLVRAIRLYAGLLKGDPKLLHEFFPGFAMAGGLAPLPRRVVQAMPEVEIRESSDAERLENALELFDGLEF